MSSVTALDAVAGAAFATHGVAIVEVGATVLAAGLADFVVVALVIANPLEFASNSAITASARKRFDLNLLFISVFVPGF
jgi:hypothetical protein